MKLVKLAATLGIIVIFVGGFFIGVVGGGRVINAVLKTYVFNVEDCRYDYRPIERTETPVNPEETCEIDYNGAKGDIASGLAMLIITLPTGIYLYWFQIRKMLA